MGLREAAVWSAVWVALALAFNGLVLRWAGPVRALEFLTGYVVEKSLSVDNIFVFVLLFAAFRVPDEYQHRVLFWGVLGALILRGILIGAGTLLIREFHWVLYVFGALLFWSGLRMIRVAEEQTAESAKRLTRFLRRWLPLTDGYRGQRFLVREEGRLLATPLLLVLLVVELTDLVFAVDSIPAVFAITTDPFVVFTSNVFAILGLRAMYFLLGGVVKRFHYLRAALAVILVFVGAKMLLVDLVKVPVSLSLAFISLVLLVSIGLSVLRARGSRGGEPQASGG